MKARRALAGRLLLGLAGAAVLLQCAPGKAREKPQGVVLISLSALRADALGFGGREPSVTPFLDSLARRALVYERAVTTSPGTLAAHVSMFTGLYPIEHRVEPPDRVLSAEVPVLAERFADQGFATAAFTDGGYLSSDFGFDRGFDEFAVAGPESRTSFEQALDFLDRVGERRFFLFVHTDALEKALARADEARPAGVSRADGEAVGSAGGGARFDLERLASGRDALTSEGARRMRQRYLEAVRRLDRELEAFFARLEASGSSERTIVVVTADHGFEMGEHGRVGHRQVYPETLAVPLLLAAPGLEPERVQTLAQTVDIAPSLYSLAGLPVPRLSGRILAGLPGAPGPRLWAAAQAHGRREQRTLLMDLEGARYQYVRSRHRGEHDGTWVTREVTFDTRADRLDLSIVSFSKPRVLRLLQAGKAETELRIAPAWTPVSVPLGSERGRKRVTIRADSCDSPRDLGAGADRRCLSFKLRGLELAKTELFDLRADPGARVDVSWELPDVASELKRSLAEIVWHVAPPPEFTAANEPALAAIGLRGEYPEPP